ncbi:MAG: hypothetical protein RL120_06440, partial [Gammaproteobacteria bacterium]
HDGLAVSHVDALFEIDLGEGSVSDSGFTICVGGTSCADASAMWTASVDYNDLDEQILSASISGDYTDLTQSEPVPVGFYGIFDGIFVGSSGNGFGATLSFGGEGGEIGGQSGPYIAGVALFKTDLPSSSDFNAIGGRVGFTLFDPDDGVINGATSSVSGSEFLIGQTDPGTPRDFNFADFTRALKGSLLSGDVTIQSQNVGGFDLTFGHWNDKVDTKLYDQAGFIPDAGSDFTVFASGTPASLGLLSGIAHFEQSGEYLIADENGIVSPSFVTGQFDIDLSSGFFVNDTFSFSVCFNDSEGCEEEWSLGSSALNGAQLTQGVLQDRGVSGSISGYGVSPSTFSGSWNGFVVGETSEVMGFAAGFLFTDNSDSTNFLKGAALFDKQVTPVAIDQGDFDSFGFALLANVTHPSALDGRLSFVGNSRSDWWESPDFESPDVISFAGGSLNGSTLINGDPDHILDINSNSGNAFLTSAGPWEGYFFRWNASDGFIRIINNDINDSSDSFSAEPFDTFVFTVPVDSVAAATSLTGTHTMSSYTSGNTFTGNGSWGTVFSVDMILDIDFSSGITDGQLSVSAGEGQDWEVGFSAPLVNIFSYTSGADPNLDIGYFRINQNQFTSSSISTDPGSSVSGDILGIFMDGDGELGLVGGFNLHETGDNSNYVVGGFTLTSLDHISAQEKFSLESSSTNGMFVSGSPSNHHFSEVYGGPVHTTGNDTDPVFVARGFSSAGFYGGFDFTTESILRSDGITKSAVAGSNGITTWGHWGIPPGSGNPNDETFSRLSFNSSDGSSDFDGTGGHDAYWFIADPSLASSLPTTGTFLYQQILSLQGTYSTSALGGTGVPTFGALNDLINTIFQFELDFDTGGIDGDFKLISSTVDWSADFTGTLEDSTGAIGDGPFININDFSSTVFRIAASPVSFVAETTGEISGYFTGGATAGGTEGIGLAFNIAGSDALSTNYSMYGTILLNGDGTDVTPGFSLPDSSVDEYEISWGQWDNPVEDNWVVVNPAENGAVELQTSNHLALVDPTPVANLTGSGSYATTIASDFVGSGSAGDVTQVVAGMDVDFNTGLISNGSLQVQVAGSQAWEIDFAGSVNGGMVDINSLGGTLSDPGGLISNQIDANLGGVFTGGNAEAFVGGFDMIDQLNELNYVDGLYTIER